MEFALKCDKCDADAVFGFSFQTKDGQPLSQVWNRCRGHAVEPLPDKAPYGSVVTITSPKPSDPAPARN